MPRQGNSERQGIPSDREFRAPCGEHMIILTEHGPGIPVFDGQNACVAHSPTFQQPRGGLSAHRAVAPRRGNEPLAAVLIYGGLAGVDRLGVRLADVRQTAGPGRSAAALIARLQYLWVNNLTALVVLDRNNGMESQPNMPGTHTECWFHEAIWSARWVVRRRLTVRRSAARSRPCAASRSLRSR